MSEPVEDGGVVSRRSVLDLSHLSSPEQLAGITRIERVATVIVPQSLAGAYARIPSSRVAATVYVPDGANVRLHTGPLMVGGDGLGAADDVLVVIGMLIITSPVTGTVPGPISVIGSVLAPRGSEGALGPVLGGGVGNVSYYRYVEGQDIKVLVGQVKLSGAMLANPAGEPDDILIATGQVVVTGSVSTVGYRQVVVAGQLIAPAASRDLLEPRMAPAARVHAAAGQHRGHRGGTGRGRGRGDQAVARAAAPDPDDGRRRRHDQRRDRPALGIPAGTVRYRLSLARRTLSAALADYDDPATAEER